MSRLHPLCLSLLLSASAITVAVEPASTAGLDANGDGSVSREEFLDFRRERLLEQDADGDGVLDNDEFLASLPADAPRMMRRRAFGQFDTDRDGKVSGEELKAGPARGFDRADRNGDGVLDADEAAEIRQQFEERRG